MTPQQEGEVREKFSLITRGLLSLRNALEGLVAMRATGVARFDGDAETRAAFLEIVTRASKTAVDAEIGALVSEYGPEARHVLE